MVRIIGSDKNILLTRMLFHEMTADIRLSFDSLLLMMSLRSEDFEIECKTGSGYPYLIVVPIV
jgi:hypothetical protein